MTIFWRAMYIFRICDHYSQKRKGILSLLMPKSNKWAMCQMDASSACLPRIIEYCVMVIAMETSNIYRQVPKLLRLAGKAYAPYKKQILALTGLGFLGGILEGIGINAVIPLLSSVLGLHDAATDTLSVYIKDFFALIHVPFVPRYILAFIVILFIGKALVTLWISYIQLIIANEYLRATQSKLFKIDRKST